MGSVGEWFERTFVPESAPEWSISKSEAKRRSSTGENESNAAQAAQKAQADKAASDAAALEETRVASARRRRIVEGERTSSLGDPNTYQKVLLGR